LFSIVLQGKTRSAKANHVQHEFTKCAFEYDVRMRLWLSGSSDVSIRDQLATQVVLSILSGELKPGQRLPSTRELARRFHVHPNTVSAGYRELARNQWVDFQKGSGIFVRKERPDSPSQAIALDQVISKFFQAARETGASLSSIRLRLRHWLEVQPPDHFLLIEPDAALAEILVSEIKAAVTLPVKNCELLITVIEALVGAIPLALSMNEKGVRRALSESTELLILQLGSPAASLATHLPAPSSALVGVASSWPKFLKTAHTMLIAAGFPAECLVMRDASTPDWQRGLKQVAAIVCDTFTAHKLNEFPRVLTFPLLAEPGLQALRRYEEFLQQPFAL
jgi:DNA-binding transcriptional regulator YhcF (GntR family)